MLLPLIAEHGCAPSRPRSRSSRACHVSSFNFLSSLVVALSRCCHQAATQSEKTLQRGSVGPSCCSIQASHPHLPRCTSVVSCPVSSYHHHPAWNPTSAATTIPPSPTSTTSRFHSLALPSSTYGSVPCSHIPIHKHPARHPPLSCVLADPVHFTGPFLIITMDTLVDIITLDNLGQKMPRWDPAATNQLYALVDMGR